MCCDVREEGGTVVGAAVVLSLSGVGVWDEICSVRAKPYNYMYVSWCCDQEGMTVT